MWECEKEWGLRQSGRDTETVWEGRHAPPTDGTGATRLPRNRSCRAEHPAPQQLNRREASAQNYAPFNSLFFLLNILGSGRKRTAQTKPWIHPWIHALRFRVIGGVTCFSQCHVLCPRASRLARGSCVKLQLRTKPRSSCVTHMRSEEPCPVGWCVLSSNDKVLDLVLGNHKKVKRAVFLHTRWHQCVCSG